MPDDPDRQEAMTFPEGEVDRDFEYIQTEHRDPPSNTPESQLSTILCCEKYLSPPVIHNPDR